MKEFEFIAHLQQRFAGHAESAPHAPVLAIGDDAAILDIPPDRQVAVSTDTLVSDVHFASDDSPDDIGAKALAVNLSDLAAMGAEPAWFFLNLSLPEIDPTWCDGFTDGLLEVAKLGRIQLAGGDTTRGPLAITVTVMGLVPKGAALRRDGAKVGELIVVSGQPGLAALGLQQQQSGAPLQADARRALKRPQPRVELGLGLLGKANACIDVSDGLAADLGHILKASGCGAEIRLAQLPRSAAFDGLADGERWQLQLGGGDDYELCFTLPRKYRGELAALQKSAGVPVHVIGETTAGSELTLLQPNGEPYSLHRSGYQHFDA